MKISQKQRTTVLAVVAGLLALSYVGYTTFKPQIQRLVVPKKPQVAVAKKPSAPVKTTEIPEVAPASENANPPKEALPEPPAVVELPPVTAAPPPQPVPREPMGNEIPDLTSRLPAERTLSEPDPRQTGGFPAQIFVRLDLNGDLRLQPQEIPTNYREQMLALDENSDGLVNFVEFDHAIDKLPEPASLRTTSPASALINPPDPGKEIPIYDPMDPMASRRATPDAPLWFTNLDRSRDGHIAVYEWPAGRLNEFRALDTNDDGFITLEEARKAEAIKEAAEAERRSQELPTSPNSSRPRENPLR